MYIKVQLFKVTMAEGEDLLYTSKEFHLSEINLTWLLAYFYIENELFQLTLQTICSKKKIGSQSKWILHHHLALMTAPKSKTHIIL